MPSNASTGELGSDSVVQVPNNVSNHLTSGLLKYFYTTGRFASAINLFEKLRTQNVEVCVHSGSSPELEGGEVRVYTDPSRPVFATTDTPCIPCNGVLSTLTG